MGELIASMTRKLGRQRTQMPGAFRYGLYPRVAKEVMNFEQLQMEVTRYCNGQLN